MAANPRATVTRDSRIEASGKPVFHPRLRGDAILRLSEA